MNDPTNKDANAFWAVVISFVVVAACAIISAHLSP